MDFLKKWHSTARPFVNDIQKEISRHWDALDTSPHSNNYEIVEDTSTIGQLPAEIKHTICSFLPIKDLVRLAQVSCIWNVLCSEEVHWKRVFDEEKINWDSVQICNTINPSLWNKFVRASSNVTDYLSNDGNSTTSQQSVISSTTPTWKTIFLLNYLSNNVKVDPATSLNGDIAETEHNMDTLATRANNITSNTNAITQAIKANTPDFANRLASRISPAIDQLKVPFKKIHRIPMLGEGLESTSKDLLYSMMWPNGSPMFSVTGLYPGIEGIGSGVGFCVDNVNLNIAALHRCRLDDLRLKWRSYFNKADGVIYVVSCKSVHNVERRKLKSIVGGEEALVPSKSPLLVLLVCDDPLAPKTRPSEIIDLLDLESLVDRSWCVQNVEMATLKGLADGLRWLASKV